MSKKRALNEEVKKVWFLTNLINEVTSAPVVNNTQNKPQTQAQPAPAGNKAPQTQNQPQQAGQNIQQTSPQNVQKNVQTNMDQAMSVLAQQLPAILKNFTATVGNKDGQIEVPGQQNAQPQQVRESELKFNEEKYKSNYGELNEGGLLGLVASAPAILQLGGKILQRLGSKTNPNIVQKFGGVVAKAGESLHHKYIGAIENILNPFMRNASPDTRKKAAEALMMSLVAVLFAGSLSDPSSLSAVKGKELASYATKLAPKVLASMGFA